MRQFICIYIYIYIYKIHVTEVKEEYYIDKAIVEEQAEERSTHPGLPGNSGVHLVSDCGEEFWARF